MCCSVEFHYLERSMLSVVTIMRLSKTLSQSKNAVKNHLQNDFLYILLSVKRSFNLICKFQWFYYVPYVLSF